MNDSMLKHNFYGPVGTDVYILWRMCLKISQYVMQYFTAYGPIFALTVGKVCKIFYLICPHIRLGTVGFYLLD